MYVVGQLIRHIVFFLVMLDSLNLIPFSCFQDADRVLSINKFSVRGLLAKGEAQYHLGMFEHSLKFFHR